MWGGTAIRMHDDVWALLGEGDAGVVLQDVSTGEVRQTIATDSWTSKGESSPTIAMTARPGGGAVLVSSRGDVALVDASGAIGKRVFGPPRCTPSS